MADFIHTMIGSSSSRDYKVHKAKNIYYVSTENVCNPSSRGILSVESRHMTCIFKMKTPVTSFLKMQVEA